MKNPAELPPEDPRVDPARGVRRLSRKPALIALGVAALALVVLLEGVLSRGRSRTERPGEERAEAPLSSRGALEALLADIPRGRIGPPPGTGDGPGPAPEAGPEPVPAASPGPDPAPAAPPPEEILPSLQPAVPEPPPGPDPGIPYPAPVSVPPLALHPPPPPPPGEPVPIRVPLPLPLPAPQPPPAGDPPGEALRAWEERREDGQAVHPWRLQQAPAPLELKAGTLIHATLMNAVRSDLPGPVLAQVDSPVYDSASGMHLLVPQGARLFGSYDPEQDYGDQRVGIAWERLIFPDGSSLTLGGMKGLDRQGQAGVRDQVHRHLGRIYGSAILLSAVSAGVALATQPREVAGTVVNVGGQASLSPQDAASREVALNLGRTLNRQLERSIDIQPTLVIRAGKRMALMVERDVGFERPWPPGPPDPRPPRKPPRYHHPLGAAP